MRREAGGAVRAVLYDLDGTLVESRHDLATAVNRARADLGFAPLAVERMLGMVGEGARNLVRRALGGAPDPTLLEQALSIFYEHYEKVCTERTAPYAGVDALLRRAGTRYPQALLTNKPERFARKIIEHLGWGGTFRMVIGGDTLASRKPEPAGLLSIVDALGVAAEEALLVGDSRIDAATAAAAGSRLVLVEWGFADAAQREELARHAWVRSAGELEAVLGV